MSKAHWLSMSKKPPAKGMKPCPFCKGDELRVGDKGTEVFIYCYICGARGPTATTKAAAIEKWDTREVKVG
jgi:Lar family restriction alleviation protein